MEVASLGNNSIRIKGKHASCIINPHGKVSGVNTVLLLNNHSLDTTVLDSEIVVIKAPGEYEIAGMKITGFRNGGETVYKVHIDGVVILIARAASLEKEHNKLTDQDIVILFTDTKIDASFITALEPRSVIFYGPQSEETIKLFAKEAFRTEAKYQTTHDKLPQEMESILLQ